MLSNQFILKAFYRPLWLFCILLIAWNSSAQTYIKVKGKVVDAKTSEVIPFASILIQGTNRGTQTDLNGNFFIETSAQHPSIKISIIGYQSQTKTFQTAKDVQQLTVRLQSLNTSLDEVVVKGKKDKYRNKDNPAVQLVRKVIEHKSKNRPEALDFYQYNKYEKLEFDLSNISEKFRNKRSLRKFDFVFNHLDTSKITGKVTLPMYLKETISDVYYRKNPESKKEVITGDKMTGLGGYVDNNGIKLYLEALYQEVNFYDNNILLLAKQFLGPTSPIAPQFYRYAIIDTTVYKDVKCITLGFAPRNTNDQLFQGQMLVAMDSSYAVRKVEMGFSKDINVNFVTDLKIAQEFEFVGDKGLMLTKDDLIIEFNPLKKENGMSLFGQRSVSYHDYKLNVPIVANRFEGYRTEVLKDATQRKDDYWSQARHQPLSTKEMGIYTMVDSVKSVPAFQRFMNTASFLMEGYKPLGAFEIGPVNTFYSFNPVEGLRLRLGGRTTAKFSERMAFEVYSAYGFRDHKWKYFASATLSLTDHNIYTYPIRHLRLSYQNDLKIPGQELQFVQEDNFLLSFKRGINNQRTYNQVWTLDWLRESKSGVAWSAQIKKTIQTPTGSLTYENGLGQTVPQLDNTEFGVGLRYAPNEQFYQGKNYRIPIVNQYPVIQLRYNYSPKGFLGSEYEYSRVMAQMYKRVNIPPLGYTNLTIEGAKLWGKVPFPLLLIHRANQTYSYQLESYNLMNFLEFVSDQYATIFFDHHFNGFFFNKIPLLNRLKIREVATFTGLWGSVSDQNKPSSDNQLLAFPKYANGDPITYSLDHRPYMEMSVGVENVFKILRIDLLKRLSYLDHPNAPSALAIRFRVKFDF
ncbi:DUF5686 and carboxypeptidase-like regulatory domain-containing protein [Flectobacillus roseus]|uniref:DUF5686 family protein n=1 Tax=Flectobacillus roseus TaxID=502259 RepID=A0ABT6YC42_9BACT|nr:DUF5686 and carboxypeptidase-like regulatory domain-containing protein [Flectobacillus roseus]MDI9861100.1 DUF5686 family protein [Flectobacillus roseus]